MPRRCPTALDRPLARAVLQRYYDGADIGMPGARFSERGLALLVGKKYLFAAKELIDAGNEALGERTRVVLTAGDEYDGDDYAGRLTRSVDKPLFRVIARVTPSKVKQADPMLEALRKYNPVPDDTERQLAIKSEGYRQFVTEQMDKIGRLVLDTMEFVKRESVGVKNIDFPMTTAQELAFRNDILQPFMMSSKIASQYLDEARLYLTFNDGELLPSFNDLVSFASVAEDTRRKVLKVELDRANQNELILPTDCFTAALSLGATHTKAKASPEIGETHFVDLGGETGWVNHWATVLMRDGQDTITLENAAGIDKGPMDRTTWWFGMYGTRKPGQSFEEEYKRLSSERTNAMAKRISDIAERRTTEKRLEYVRV